MQKRIVSLVVQIAVAASLPNILINKSDMK
jgi:hypothetical protein